MDSTIDLNGIIQEPFIEKSYERNYHSSSTTTNQNNNFDNTGNHPIINKSGLWNELHEYQNENVINGRKVPLKPHDSFILSPSSSTYTKQFDKNDLSSSTCSISSSSKIFNHQNINRKNASVGELFLASQRYDEIKKGTLFSIYPIKNCGKIMDQKLWKELYYNSKQFINNINEEIILINEACYKNEIQIINNFKDEEILINLHVFNPSPILSSSSSSSSTPLSSSSLLSYFNHQTTIANNQATTHHQIHNKESEECLRIDVCKKCKSTKEFIPFDMKRKESILNLLQTCILNASKRSENVPIEGSSLYENDLASY